MPHTNITPSTKADSAYVRQQLVAYNAAHVSEDLKNRYEELHFHIRNEAGQIVAGVLTMIENAPTGHQQYYFKKDLVRSEGAEASR